MKVSVAICTWNRSKLLDQTLGELQKLLIPSGTDWEVLVVNNRCTDETDRVIQKHRDRLPLHRLFEEKQGHSNARNTAIHASAGELILWTDDDVLVHPNWLAAYVEAARRWPDAAFFGGRIAPWYESHPPTWITDHMPLVEGMLVIRDLGSEERLLVGEEKVFGANMGFRRWVFNDRQFDPRLGRMGGDSILGDETALHASLHEEGLRGVWVPKALVRHFVPTERMTRSYFWQYFQGLGRTEVRAQGPPEGTKLGGVPRWLYRKYWQALRQYYWRRVIGNSDWVLPYKSLAQIRGAILECRQAVPQNSESKQTLIPSEKSRCS